MATMDTTSIPAKMMMTRKATVFVFFGSGITGRMPHEGNEFCDESHEPLGIRQSSGTDPGNSSSIGVVTDVVN